MSVEICLYIAKKEIQNVNRENIEENCLFLDFFGGSWVLGGILYHSVDIDACTILTPKLYSEVKEELDNRIKDSNDKLNDCNRILDRLTVLEELDACMNSLNELRDELKEAESSRDYWSFINGLAEYNVIYITVSY